MVCERWSVTVCGERWCVTMWCVKDGVSMMVGDKVVCERWCVTKMVCDSEVCQRWCVTKWCVKDGL